MKKISELWSLVLVLTLILTGCSKTQTVGDMLNNVPDNVDVVITANPASVLRSFGCKVGKDKIEDSEAMKDCFSTKALSSRDRDALDDALAVKGVNLEAAVIAMKFDDQRVIGILNVLDKEAFISWVENLDNSFTRTKYEGEVAVSLDDTSFIIFDGNLAFIADGESARDAARNIEKFRKKAEDKPLQSWKKDYLADNLSLGIVTSYEFISQSMLQAMPRSERAQLNAILSSINIDGLEDSFVCAGGVLDGHSATLSYQLFDKNGKELVMPNLKGININKDLLKYASKEDCIVGIMGLPKDYDWETMINSMAASMYISDRQVLNTISDVMSALTGSVMVSFGIQPGAVEFDELSSYHLVIAADVDNAKAAQYVDMIIANLNPEGLRVDRISDNTIKLIRGRDIKAESIWEDEIESEGYDFSDPEVEFYVYNAGGQLVISNKPISTEGGCTVELGNLDGVNTVLALKLDKANPFAKMLGLKLEGKIRIALTASKCEGSVEIVGNDEEMPLLQTIFTETKKFY